MVFSSRTTRANWNLTLMAARTTRGVFDVDAVGELDVDVQYGALTRKVGTSAEWRLFGIAYHDGRSVLKTDNRPTAAGAMTIKSANWHCRGEPASARRHWLRNR